MAPLRPFKVRPFIVWTFIIVLVAMVIFGSTRSNYQARGSMAEVVYDKPTTNANSPPMVSLSPDSTVTPLRDIPSDTFTPLTHVPPNLFPEPADKMQDYSHVNLPNMPLAISIERAVRMIPLDEADDSMYPANLDEVFAASEQQGFMQASVDTLYDVMKQTPPRLMTDQVCLRCTPGDTGQERYTKATRQRTERTRYFPRSN